MSVGLLRTSTEIIQFACSHKGTWWHIKQPWRHNLWSSNNKRRKLGNNKPLLGAYYLSYVGNTSINDGLHIPPVELTINPLLSLIIANKLYVNHTPWLVLHKPCSWISHSLISNSTYVWSQNAARLQQSFWRHCLISKNIIKISTVKKNWEKNEILKQQQQNQWIVGSSSIYETETWHG